MGDFNTYWFLTPTKKRRQGENLEKEKDGQSTDPFLCPQNLHRQLGLERLNKRDRRVFYHSLIPMDLRGLGFHSLCFFLTEKV